MRSLIILTFIVLCGSLLPGYSYSMDANASIMPAEKNEYSIDLGQLTSEEKEWFVLFHEGTFFAEGWKDITQQILMHTPEELQHEQRTVLNQLGNRIALEWCKDNAVRKVNNTMLKQWGGELKTTAKKNPEQLPNVIASISREVDFILD